MSIAPRETKCFISCQARAGQSRLGHWVKMLSAGLTVGVSQKGQRSGGRGSGGRFLCSATCGAGETTCGITSPALTTITSSPSRMSLRTMSSSLWSVAILIVTPPTSTGARTA